MTARRTPRTRIATFLVSAIAVFSLLAGTVAGQVYIHANGGIYFTQYGNGANFFLINSDGYCVSGRGPCDPSLWYLQWTYNHSGCGFEESAQYQMAAELNYFEDTYAWIDDVTGNMYGADYELVYDDISTYAATVDQNAYSEQWGTIALDIFKVKYVYLTDGWGALYMCNGVGGRQVEFDEIKLEL